MFFSSTFTAQLLLSFNHVVLLLQDLSCFLSGLEVLWNIDNKTKSIVYLVQWLWFCFSSNDDNHISKSSCHKPCSLNNRFHWNRSLYNLLFKYLLFKKCTKWTKWKVSVAHTKTENFNYLALRVLIYLTYISGQKHEYLYSLCSILVIFEKTHPY